MQHDIGGFLVVAAIDFGTTYSGYAFSFKDDPERVHANNQWEDDEGLFATFKTPTSILFDKSGIFHSFGYDAESEYHDLSSKGLHRDWRFFKRFKMSLYRELMFEEHGEDAEAEQMYVRRPSSSLTKSRYKGLTRELEIRDDLGRSMSAMTVFSSAIKYLKSHCWEFIKDNKAGLKETDIKWVITVPAIWTDPSKQFMREAALQAGIQDNRLLLALEPEAAAIYCEKVSIRKSNDEKLISFSPGEQFALIDLGGGTADITCHKVTNDGCLQELHPPTGGPWGGTTVDKAYFDFIEELVGEDVWESFKANHLNDRLDMERSFETKKRNVKRDETVFKIGAGLLETFEEEYDAPLAKTIKSKLKYRGLVTLERGKLKINSDRLKEFFKTPLDCIVHKLQCLFRDRYLSDIKTLILVGGFSESPMTLERIKESFPRLQVIRPPEAGLAVLKGAVLFGHSPHSICERSSPKTYGICASIPWRRGIHPERCYYKQDGVEVCTDVFQVMVCRGQPITMGKTFAKQNCRPAKKSDKFATIEVYESSRENPNYIFEEHVRHLGDIEVTVPQRFGEKHIEVIMHFGSTELRVSAEVVGTNHKAQVRFDCLHG